jgi:hypothetical protein
MCAVLHILVDFGFSKWGGGGNGGCQLHTSCACTHRVAQACCTLVSCVQPLQLQLIPPPGGTLQQHLQLSCGAGEEEAEEGGW